MKTSSTCAFLALAAALLSAQPTLAAPSVSTLVGVVGGQGNANIAGGCTTYGQPVEAAFYNLGVPFMPVGGVASCGYSGGYDSTLTAAGPLTSQRSLPPVILGNPGYSGYFDGTADATSNFKSLKVAAHANIAGGTPGSPLALFNSEGAAGFSDTLTVTSPQAAANSPGWVRFQFSVAGKLASLGAPAANFFGDTFAVLDLQLGGGPVYQLLSAHETRGSLGTISNGSPPAGWITSMGSLAGGSDFFSVDLPMVWAESMDIKVGLLAWAYGTADVSASAVLSGMSFFDANLNQITEINVASASGTDYLGTGGTDTGTVSEPGSLALMLVCLLALTRERRRSARRVD
jgi:hypothetical protein